MNSLPTRSTPTASILTQTMHTPTTWQRAYNLIKNKLLKTKEIAGCMTSCCSRNGEKPDCDSTNACKVIWLAKSVGYEFKSSAILDAVACVSATVVQRISLKSGGYNPTTVMAWLCSLCKGDSQAHPEQGRVSGRVSSPACCRSQHLTCITPPCSAYLSLLSEAQNPYEFIGLLTMMLRIPMN